MFSRAVYQRASLLSRQRIVHGCGCRARVPAQRRGCRELCASVYRPPSRFSLLIKPTIFTAAVCGGSVGAAAIVHAEFAASGRASSTCVVSVCRGSVSVCATSVHLPGTCAGLAPQILAAARLAAR